MACSPCVTKLAYRLVKNHPKLDLITAYCLAEKAVERVEKRRRTENPTWNRLQILPGRGNPSDYSVVCTGNCGTSSCNGGACTVNADCTHGACSGSPDACPSPPKANSHYVSDNCACQAPSDTLCTCNTIIGRCNALIHDCSISGSCQYACDPGYKWNATTEECEKVRSGLNFFTNGVDVTPGTAGSWQDVDVSSYLPSWATGVILDIHNTDASNAYKCDVRKKTSTDDDYANGVMQPLYHVYAITGVDTSLVFQAKIENTAVKIYLVGYTDDRVTVFTNKKAYLDYAPYGNWHDTDVSSDVPSGATGVIVKILNTNATVDLKGSIRKNGSSDDRAEFIGIHREAFIFLMCGVDGNRVFEQWTNSDYVKLYLVGYTLTPVTFFTNAVNKSFFSPTGSWVDRDVTDDTDPDADGVILDLINDDTSIRKLEVRKNGSTDTRYASAYIEDMGHIGAFVGVDDSQIYEQKIELGYWSYNTFIMGYCKPYVVVVAKPPIWQCKTRGGQKQEKTRFNPTLKLGA